MNIEIFRIDFTGREGPDPKELLRRHGENGTQKGGGKGRENVALIFVKLPEGKKGEKKVACGGRAVFKGTNIEGGLSQVGGKGTSDPKAFQS